MDAVSQLSNLNTIATESALSAWAYASDFLIVIILFAVLFVFAWYVGRGPFVGLLISFYAGYALYTVFPFFYLLPSEPPLAMLLSMLAVFALLCGVAYLVLRRAVVSDFISIGLIGLIILSLLGAGFLLVLAYHTFPVREVYAFSPTLDLLFAAKQYFFWWFSAPLVGLFFLAR
ncbi:MAG: hypothetical protein Q7R54_00140 [bacterium]|nr:hypothetical protein [bacterium]